MSWRDLVRGNDLDAKIVREILEDLTDRRGLKHEWNAIGAEIQEEIVMRWRELTRREISSATSIG